MNKEVVFYHGVAEAGHMGRWQKDKMDVTVKLISWKFNYILSCIYINF
jgi:hypothetical protein